MEWLVPMNNIFVFSKGEPFLLATIEHSGTFRTLGFLERNVCPLEEKHKYKHGMIFFTHLYDERMDEIVKAAEQMPIITTERPFEDIKKSWITRNKDLKELDKQWQNYKKLLKFDPYIFKLGRII